MACSCQDPAKKAARAEKLKQQQAARQAARANRLALSPISTQQKATASNDPGR